MILDNENMFFHNVNASTSGSIHSKVIDLGPGDAGHSERISVFLTSSEPYTSVDGMRFTLITGDALDGEGYISSGPTGMDRIQIPLPAALDESGRRLVACRLPHGCKRYLHLETNVGFPQYFYSAGLVWDMPSDGPVPTGPSGI